MKRAAALSGSAMGRQPSLCTVSAESMASQSSRPFCGEYAWAFDLLIDRPIRKECAAITAWLIERGLHPRATLLDAGCGTGRYARELARRGYTVEGVDQSPELIEIARQFVGPDGHSVSFRVGDLLDLPAAEYDGILCRGVLNDFVDDDARRSVFAAFAGLLRREGVLILDVREWEGTKHRKRREPFFERGLRRIEARSRSRARRKSTRIAISFFCRKRTHWSTTLANSRPTLGS
jgi:SAM-dependent methyltransferase